MNTSVEGTYPNEQVLLNISKETTSKELCRIAGRSEALQRAVGINLSGGYVNAVEICTSLFMAPSFDRLLVDFQATLEGKDPDEYVTSNMSVLMQERMEEYVLLAEEETDEEDEESVDEVA